MDIFEKEKLPDIAGVEQSCATGLTSEGKVPKSLVEEMVPLLDSRTVINLHKVRIICLYIQYRDGVPDEDRRRSYQHARLTIAEQDAVNSLMYLGVKISKNPTDKDSKKSKHHKATTGEEYELSRFKPCLKTVIEDQVGDRLDSATFPYVKDAPSLMPVSPRSPPPQTTSLRSQKPAWHRAPKTATVLDNRQRVLIFVVGGVTYSEIRETYQLSNSLQKDIYIGSTHTITPRRFIDDLKVLDLDGAGSKAIPNGLRDMRGEPKSPQDLYDEKYFVQEALPPQQPQPPQKSVLGIPSRSTEAVQPSRTSSYQSSVSSLTPSAKEEKKKKRGILSRFGG
jgi:syntaxin-binding protein 1